MAVAVIAGRRLVVRVPAVHEEMDERAEQEQRVWQHPKQMRPMLLPQEKDRDREKHAQPEPERDVLWALSARFD